MDYRHLQYQLDRTWSAKRKAETKSRVNIDKYFEIPELCLEKSVNGTISLSKEKRHSLLGRFRVFRLNTRYMTMVETAKELGFIVIRRNGKHTVMPDDKFTRPSQFDIIDNVT